MTARKQINICLFLFFCMLFINSPSMAKEYTFDYQKIIPLTEPIELDLQTVMGNITITGTDGNRIIVEAEKSVRASGQDEAEEVADHIEIKVKKHNNKVTVNTNYLRMINRSPSFWSKIFGTSGNESFGAVNYNIKVPTQTSLVINSMEAKIELSNIEGVVNIKNNSGITHGEYLFGPITLSQPVGEVELKWIEGDIRIKSNSSRIFIQQVKGAVDIATYSGAVTIQTNLDSPKNYYVETTSGSINFSVPSSSSGTLKIETETGNIKTEIPIAIKSVTRHHLVGEFGEGGPAININSTTGDVNVNQY